jgi:hypothetical protein
MPAAALGNALDTMMTHPLALQPRSAIGELGNFPRLRNRCRTGDHTQAGRGQTTGTIGRRCSNQTGAPKTVQRPTRSTPP